MLSELFKGWLAGISGKQPRNATADGECPDYCRGCSRCTPDADYPAYMVGYRIGLEDSAQIYATVSRKCMDNGWRYSTDAQTRGKASAVAVGMACGAAGEEADATARNDGAYIIAYNEAVILRAMRRYLFGMAPTRPNVVYE